MEFQNAKKKFEELYNVKPGKPVIVNVPELQFLSVNGTRNSNTSQDF